MATSHVRTQVEARDFQAGSVDAVRTNTIRRSKIQVLDRSACLINLLGEVGQPLNLKALSERSGLHTATCHRLLEALCVHDIVRRTSEPKGYILVRDANKHGTDGYRRMLITDIADTMLRELSGNTQSTVRLLFRDNHDLVCDSVNSNGQKRSDPSTRIRLHRESIGVHWLGHLGIQYVRQYLESLNSQYPFEQISFLSLWSLASKSIANGYSKDTRDSSSSIVTVGTLIRDRSNLPVAAITIKRDLQRSEEKTVMDVLAVAKEISDVVFPE